MGRRAVLFALILAVLAPVSCRRLALREERPDISCLPADSIFVASVDVARLRQAPLYQSLDAEPGQLKTFLLRLGTDPDRDLDEVVFAFRSTGVEPGEWLVVLRGRFDRARIEKGMEDPAARMSVEPYRGRNIYNLVRVPEIGDVSLSVVDSTAMVLGKSDAVRKVLDVKGKAAPSLEMNEAMKGLVAGLDRKAQVWAVLDGKELARLVERRRRSLPDAVPESALRNLSAVVSARLSAVVTEDLAVSLEMGSGTEKEAGNLADAVRGILAFAKLGTQGRDPEAAALVETISVAQSGTGVHVRMGLPGDLVRRLRERMREVQPIPGPAATP